MSGKRAADSVFDYIVVGAGTAGCVLAARLSEDPALRVCLIEAGGSERHPFIAIPAAVGAAILSQRFGWGLETIPQQALGGRRVPLPRGKLLGGSGSINGMAYYRGPARDFDDWAARGNPGWSYAELLPYFLRAEDNPEYAGSAWHGQGGPMRVSFPKSPNPLCEAFNQAMADLGFPPCPDFNAPEPDGYGYRQGTLREGRRVSTASAYLRPALARSNLTLLTRQSARRILLEQGRAQGVEVQTPEGPRRLRAEREVLLCGGAFHSPQLLLLSGIGAPEELEALGLSCWHALPGVGRHLQDHPASYLALDMADTTSYGLSWPTLPRALWNGLEYALWRRGPLASNLFETNAYIRSREGLDRPDLQIVFQPARRNPSPFPLPLGHGFAISVVCLYPQSQGRVSLNSPDPLAPPRIDPQLGSVQADIDALTRGLRLARRIVARPAFARYQAQERLPGPGVDDEAALRDWARRSLATVHHPGGSCRMGPAPEAGDVVDAALRVHGLAGLRVVDASIYPRLVGGNTNASVVAIAEKAADLILGRPTPAPSPLWKSSVQEPRRQPEEEQP